MAAYRVYDPNPVYLNILATEPLRGGRLFFYDIGTTTPKDTWSDVDLTVLNTNPVVLDGAGRMSVNVFGDGDYTIRAEDSAGALQWTRDVTSGQTAGQTIPPLDVDEFLTNDGSNLLWAAIRQLPDATGSTGQVPVTNGGGPAGYTLQNLPTANATAITFPTGGIKISNGTTAWMIQRGGATVPANGSGPTNSVAVNFGTAFSAPPTVLATINGQVGTSNPGGGICAIAVNGVSNSGFSAHIDTNQLTFDLINATPIYWVAVGTIAP